MNLPVFRRWGLFTLVAGLAGTPACSRNGTDATSPTAAAPDSGPHYTVVGEVIEVDVPHQTLLVQHEAIKGYMPGMTMPFLVSAVDLAAWKKGDKIRAELKPDDPKGPRLINIWPADPVQEARIKEAAATLRQDTMNLGRNPYRADPGNLIPRFALYNQDGQLVDAGRLQGRQVVIDFIYTQCPFPQMCPLSTQKMMEIQKQARAAGVTNLELVSISLDPSNDTPAVLKAYAKAREIDTSNFTFLTGPESAIRDLLAQLGVIAEFKDGVIKHNLVTLLIDTTGKIAGRQEGSDWDPEQFVRKMKRE